jgi:hypothetical protein
MVVRIGAGWIALLSLVLAVLRSPAAAFPYRRHLVMEKPGIAAPTAVLNRTVKDLTLRNSDRLFWCWRSRRRTRRATTGPSCPI